MSKSKKKYTVVVESTYEVEATDKLNASIAAMAVASGCNDDADLVCREYELAGCKIKCSSSRNVDITERKTFAELSKEAGQS